MKDVSTYLNVISTVLFLGAFIALFFKRTVKRYRYIVMVYGVGVGLSVISDLFKMLYTSYTTTGYIFTVASDVLFITLAIWFYKMYRKWVDLNTEDNGPDKEQEWVLVEEWVLADVAERGGVTKPQFVSEAVPLKKNSYITSPAISSAQVFVSAGDACEYKRTHRVPESYIPVPKAFFTNS